jgi:hypothetical protein
MTPVHSAAPAASSWRNALVRDLADDLQVVGGDLVADGGEKTEEVGVLLVIRELKSHRLGHGEDAMIVEVRCQGVG